MEGNSNWKTNEQGRDSFANNASDWRSMNEPDLRKRVTIAIVEKLKIYFPNRSQDDINHVAFESERKIYGMATDKGDYLRKLSEKIQIFDEQFRSVRSVSSVNGPNPTQDPAQALNQAQSLPTSLPYTQTPTSQQWFHQNNLHHESFSFSTAAQSLNIQMGEGVDSDTLLTGYQRQTQGRQQFHSHPQHQPQSYNNDMFQYQMDQQLPKDTSHHSQPPYMQQHAQQLQYHQQQLPHHTSLSTIHQSFPQPSALSSLTPPGQQNSQFLPRQQFPTQRMALLSQEQEREQFISQLLNGEDTLQNHLTSLQNNWEQQGASTVSSPHHHQNNIASFQEMSQQNNNMHQQQHLYSYSNNASAFPSQQQKQQYMPGGQSGNFNVYESSFLGSQGQEVGSQSHHQYQQNRILQQHLDDTQRFQAEASFHQTQNIQDQHNQPYQLQRAPPANPSSSQDSTGKIVNANGGDWKEETYQKIKALKDKYLPVISTLLQKLSDKLREADSLPEQNRQHEPIQKLMAGKTTLEKVTMFLNVSRDSISERHRDSFSMYEEQILRFTKKNQTLTRRLMQDQQSQSGHNQVHVSQSLDSDQMNPRLMPSHHQNGASSQIAMPHSFQTRVKMEAKDESNIMSHQSSVFHEKHFHHLQMQHQLMQSQQSKIQNQSSSQMVDLQALNTTFHNTGSSLQSGGSPFVVHSPNLGDLENPIYVESPFSHDTCDTIL